eukprot:gene48876-59849_t
MIQKSPATPVKAPAAPNIVGIKTLDALMVMRRKPSASPWRSCGVIWCNMLMTMGCTAPSASPRMTEQTAMPRAEFIRG